MKNKNTKKDYKKPCIILSCIVAIMTIALIFCCANMKSSSDKEYLKLREHLFSRIVELAYQKENQVCDVDDYGLSKDNDVSIRFWCQNYDKDTHNPIGEKEYRTLYFQHPRKFEGGEGGYAEAIGE